MTDKEKLESIKKYLVSASNVATEQGERAKDDLTRCVCTSYANAYQDVLWFIGNLEREV